MQCFPGHVACMAKTSPSDCLQYCSNHSRPLTTFPSTGCSETFSWIQHHSCQKNLWYPRRVAGSVVLHVRARSPLEKLRHIYCKEHGSTREIGAIITSFCDSYYAGLNAWCTPSTGKTSLTGSPTTCSMASTLIANARSKFNSHLSTRRVVYKSIFSIRYNSVMSYSDIPIQAFDWQMISTWTAYWLGIDSFSVAIPTSFLFHARLSRPRPICTKIWIVRLQFHRQQFQSPWPRALY